MMYGMQIRQNNGKLWMSPSFTPLNFSGVLTYPSGKGTLITEYDSSMALMIFVKANVQVGTSISQEILNGKWVIKYASPGYGKIYLFTNVVNESSQYGIAMYDSNGNEVWNTSVIPLQVSVIQNPVSLSSRPYYSIPIGYSTAVCPGVVSSYSAYLGSGSYLVGVMRCIGYENTIYISRCESEIIDNMTYAPTIYKSHFYTIDTTIYE